MNTHARITARRATDVPICTVCAKLARFYCNEKSINAQSGAAPCQDKPFCQRHYHAHIEVTHQQAQPAFEED